VAVDASGDVAAAFQGAGVWRYRDSTGWKQLSTGAASQVGIDAAGQVAAAFLGAGPWRYRDGLGWLQLSTTDASLLDG
jgi:hypothetical protein